MKTFISVVVFLITSLFSGINIASADTIHLRNGDRISGKIVRMEEGKLVIKTEYAGVVTVEWEKVDSFGSDEKIKVVLEDGTALEGQPLGMEGMKMRLETEKLHEPATFDLSDVNAINPVIEPSVRITSGVNAGLIYERGNSDTDTYHIDARFQARTIKSRFGVGGEFNREEADGELTVDNWSSFANYDYFLTKKWFGYFLTLLKHDEFADLELRSTLAAGMGYQVFESDMLNLSLRAGPAYVNENFIIAEDDSFTVAQWEVNYDQFFYDRLFQLFHLSGGYISLENTDSWIINTRQGIRFPLYKGLTATIQYSYDYDNDPSPEAKADYDSKLSFLLGYEFKN